MLFFFFELVVIPICIIEASFIEIGIAMMLFIRNLPINDAPIETYFELPRIHPITKKTKL